MLQTSVGYTGGQTPAPTCRQVCSHATGRGEAVEVWFDPAAISYEQLLEAFWQIHNRPRATARDLTSAISAARRSSSTRPNRRAPALSSWDREQANRRRQIVTEIVPACAFYRR